MNAHVFNNEELTKTGETSHIIAELKQQINELQKECQKLSNQIVVFKQEKQKEKQDSPHTPLQIKEKIKEKNHYNNSKMVSEQDSEISIVRS